MNDMIPDPYVRTRLAVEYLVNGAWEQNGTYGDDEYGQDRAETDYHELMEIYRHVRLVRIRRVLETEVLVTNYVPKGGSYD